MVRDVYTGLAIAALFGGFASFLTFLAPVWAAFLAAREAGAGRSTAIVRSRSRAAMYALSLLAVAIGFASPVALLVGALVAVHVSRDPRRGLPSLLCWALGTAVLLPAGLRLALLPMSHYIHYSASVSCSDVVPWMLLSAAFPLAFGIWSALAWRKTPLKAVGMRLLARGVFVAAAMLLAPAYLPLLEQLFY
jgi:hypothetical protein